MRLRPLFALLLAAGFMAPADASEAPGLPPVLLVHGIDDTGAIFDRMADRLALAGHGPIYTIDLAPSNGDVGLSELAVQVAQKVEAIRHETGAPRIDMVGFSLGGMVSRYYLQRLDGLTRVRRFVTISAPHAGSFSAYFRWNPGAADVRWGSAFLRDLERDAEVLSAVEMTSLWTPFDMMILPSWSSRLPFARDRMLPVLVHPWMVRDDRACEAVVEALQRPGELAERP